jgi:hypothetical protein
MNSIIGLNGATRPIVVRSSLRIFGVLNAVGMHGHGQVRVVTKNYPNRVANFGADERSENPEMIPLLRAGFESLETRIRIFSIACLMVDPMAHSA